MNIINKAIETRFNEADESIRMFDENEKRKFAELLKKMTLYFDDEKN